jgi:hypothetical protein
MPCESEADGPEQVAPVVAEEQNEIVVVTVYTFYF